MTTAIDSRIEIIARLRARANELAVHRDRSVVDLESWASACAQIFIASKNVAKTEAVEAAVAFLDADPYYFCSGYIKQDMWRWLKRAPLSTNQQNQLEVAALRLLRGPIHREFWSMVNYVRARGSESYWSFVGGFSSAHEKSLSIRATWLLLARQGFPVRGWVNMELICARLQPGYKPNFLFTQSYKMPPLPNPSFNGTPNGAR